MVEVHFVTDKVYFLTLMNGYNGYLCTERRS